MTIQIDETVQVEIYKKFQNLPLRSKLIVYAKVMHSNLFRVSKNDLLGMNKRSVSRVYRLFIASLKHLSTKSKNKRRTRR